MTDFQQYFDESHQLIRDSVRRFVEREVLPHIDEWEEAEEFPVNSISRPARPGSSASATRKPTAAVAKAICSPRWRPAKSSCAAVPAAWSPGWDRWISACLRWSSGPVEVRERVVPAVLRGEKIMALAVTEPSGGSDVANLKTRAVRDGDHYRVSGSKTFITSGVRADYYTVAVRTGGEGFAGISLLLVEKGTAGFSVGRKLKKMGWWASDTAELFFDDCRVPAENLIGVENAGFACIMANFQSERLALAVMANMTAQLALEESLRWAREREAFGKPIGKFQVLRHRLAEMATQLEVSREFTYRQAAKMAAGKSVIKEISMAKNFATDVADRLTYDAVQVLGGMGYMRESLVERLYRDNRILSIGGGSREIMNEIIGKQMGL